MAVRLFFKFRLNNNMIEKKEFPSLQALAL